MFDFFDRVIGIFESILDFVVQVVGGIVRFFGLIADVTTSLGDIIGMVPAPFQTGILGILGVILIVNLINKGG